MFGKSILRIGCKSLITAHDSLLAPKISGDVIHYFWLWCQLVLPAGKCMCLCFERNCCCCNGTVAICCCCNGTVAICCCCNGTLTIWCGTECTVLGVTYFQQSSCTFPADCSMFTALYSVGHKFRQSSLSLLTVACSRRFTVLAASSSSPHFQQYSCPRLLGSQAHRVRPAECKWSVCWDRRASVYGQLRACALSAGVAGPACTASWGRVLCLLGSQGQRVLPAKGECSGCWGRRQCLGYKWDHSFRGERAASSAEHLLCVVSLSSTLTLRVWGFTVCCVPVQHNYLACVRVYCVLCSCPAHLPCVCEGLMCVVPLSSTPTLRVWGFTVCCVPVQHTYLACVRVYCVLSPCPAHLPCVCEGFLCAESLSSTIIITLFLSYFSLEEAVCFPACFRPKYAQFIFIEG